MDASLITRKSHMKCSINLFNLPKNWELNTSSNQLCVCVCVGVGRTCNVLDIYFLENSLNSQNLQSTTQACVVIFVRDSSFYPTLCQGLDILRRYRSNLNSSRESAHIVTGRNMRMWSMLIRFHQKLQVFFTPNSCVRVCVCMFLILFAQPWFVLVYVHKYTSVFAKIPD